MKNRKRIAVAAERASAYGRNFICGVAEIAEQRPEWDLALVDPETASGAAAAGHDGWICRVTDKRMAHALTRSGCPVVDCLCAVETPEFASVKTDAGRIGQLAAEHFLSRHFTNFAFCGYGRIAFSDRRRDAFARFLEKRGATPAVYRPPSRSAHKFGRDFLLGTRVKSPPDAEDVLRWLKRIPKPVGVFCCDDVRASQVMMLCKSAGFSVPDDVALLGVDDDPIYCMFSSPRLSSIDPDATEIGRAAALALAEMMDDAGKAANPPHLTIPPKGIVARESSNTYPNAPRWFAEAISFIRENAAKGISASDVFRHVGFSRTLVERVFRESGSLSVQKLIAEARLDEAKRILDSTSLPIKEVASLSGFSTLEYFSRTFATATGLTPTAWRERAFRAP